MEQFPFFASFWGAGVIAAAAVLDMLAGDPERFPHPVRFLGSLVAVAERCCRKIPAGQLLQGAMFALTVVALAGVFTVLVLKASFAVGKWLAWFVSVMVIYFSISVKCLADEALAVQHALETRGIEAGRKRVARIVGRDTSLLDEKGVVMAAIETVAENFVDGVAAPLFYAALGGPVSAACYRAVNTLDAMTGYRNSRYLLFGRVAARMDDLCNWLPARISVAAIGVASWVTGIGCAADIRVVVKKDGRSHSSPNSGFPEAAFAAALGVRLGGPASYSGAVSTHPWINGNARFPVPADIGRAVRLLWASSMIAYIAVIAAGLSLAVVASLA